MSDRFITYVIIGVAFGFTQLWFAYWVVKLYKEKQRILKARKAGVRPAQPVTPAEEKAAGPEAEGGRPSTRPPANGPA